MINRCRKKTRWIALGILALGSLAVAPIGRDLLVTAKPFQGTPDQVAIAAVVTGALNAEVRADIRPVKLPDVAHTQDDALKAWARNAPGLSAQEVSSWKDQLDSTLDRYYTGTRLGQLSEVMWPHAEEQTGASAHEIELSGGVNDVNFKSIVVNGDTASVSVEAAKWAKYVHVGNGHADIEGGDPSDAIYGLQLVRTSDGWRISEQTAFQILTNAP